MDDRFFNMLFVIGPNGKIVHKAAKNHLWCRERSTTPHDVYDRWVEVFGEGLDAFYPVLKTKDIGNIGTICCSDGEYPEAIRALAFNGAEVVYRPSEAVPMTQSGPDAGGTWLLQNRAHAHFNSLYMVCPNVGPVYVHPKMEQPYDIGGGGGHVVDFNGHVLGLSQSGTNSFCAGVIDIEALRNFRAMNLNSNWMKDLRTELFKDMYDEPIHPKNLWLENEPASHAGSTRSTAATFGVCRSAARGRPLYDARGRALRPRRAGRSGRGVGDDQGRAVGRGVDCAA